MIEFSGSGAVISQDEQFRFLLWRFPDPLFTDDPLGWIMLNPSTAGATVDDPTIRKNLGFSDRNRFSGIIVGNLSPYRTVSPTKLNKVHLSGTDTIRLEENEEHLRLLVERCRVVVLAWGANDFPWMREAATMAKRVAGDKAHCLGLTNNGAPKHPLMLPYVTPLRPLR